MNIRVWTIRLIILGGLVSMASHSASAQDKAVAGVDTGRGATCATRHVDAAATRIVEAEMPWTATAMSQRGIVKVQVDLDARGNLAKASILQSSGYDALDRSALTAVHQMAFSPEKTDCVAQSGSYAVSVDFEP